MCRITEIHQIGRECVVWIAPHIACSKGTIILITSTPHHNTTLFTSPRHFPVAHTTAKYSFCLFPKHIGLIIIIIALKWVTRNFPVNTTPPSNHSSTNCTRSQINDSGNAAPSSSLTKRDISRLPSPTQSLSVTCKRTGLH